MRRHRIRLIAIAAMIALASPLATSMARAEQPEMTKQEHAKLYLKGAQLWPIYCSQCHKARPGSEFSPAQWDTIMMHMRSRANLTGEDAQAILVYLKQR
jgi:hypothetical protein